MDKHTLLADFEVMLCNGTGFIYLIGTLFSLYFAKDEAGFAFLNVKLYLLSRYGEISTPQAGTVCYIYA